MFFLNITGFLLFSGMGAAAFVSSLFLLRERQDRQAVACLGLTGVSAFFVAVFAANAWVTPGTLLAGSTWAQLAVLLPLVMGIVLILVATALWQRLRALVQPLQGWYGARIRPYFSEGVWGQEPPSAEAQGCAFWREESDPPSDDSARPLRRATPYTD